MGATIKGLEGIGFPFGGYELTTFMDGVNYDVDGDKLALVDMKHTAGSYNYGYIRYEATEDTTLVITLENNKPSSNVAKWSAIFVESAAISPRYQPTYEQIANGTLHDGNGQYIYRSNQATSSDGNNEQCNVILKKGITYNIGFITAYSSSSAAGGSNDRFRIYNIMFVPVAYRGTGKYGCSVHNVNMRDVILNNRAQGRSSRDALAADLQNNNRPIVARVLYRDKGELKQYCGVYKNPSQYGNIVWPDSSWNNKLLILLTASNINYQNIFGTSIYTFSYDIRVRDVDFARSIESIQFLYYGNYIVDNKNNLLKQKNSTDTNNKLVFNLEHEPEPGSTIWVGYRCNPTGGQATVGLAEFIVGKSDTVQLTHNSANDIYIEYGELMVGHDESLGWCFQLVVSGNVDEVVEVLVVRYAGTGTCYDYNYGSKNYNEVVDGRFYDWQIWNKHLYYSWDKDGVILPYHVIVNLNIMHKTKDASTWNTEATRIVIISKSNKTNMDGFYVSGIDLYSYTTGEKVGNINFLDGYFRVYIDGTSSTYDYRIQLNDIEYTVYYDGDVNQKSIYSYDSRWNIDISTIKVAGSEEVDIVLLIEKDAVWVSSGQQAPRIRYLVDGIEKSWYPEWNGQQQTSSDGYVKFDGYTTYTLKANNKTVQGIQIQRVWGYEVPYIVDPEDNNNKIEVYSKGRMNDKFVENSDKLYGIIVVQTYFDTDMQRPGLATIEIDERYLPSFYEDRNMSHYIPVAIYYTDNFVAHPDSSQYYNLGAFHMESVVKQNDQASDMYYASPTYYLSKDWQDPDKYVWTFEWYVHNGGYATQDIAVQIVFLKVK